MTWNLGLLSHFDDRTRMIRFDLAGSYGFYEPDRPWAVQSVPGRRRTESRSC